MKKNFDKKKIKFTFSYFFVWFLLLCVLVMSALGCFAFIQLNYGSEKVNADESTEIIQYDNLIVRNVSGQGGTDYPFYIIGEDNIFEIAKNNNFIYSFTNIEIFTLDVVYGNYYTIYLNSSYTFDTNWYLSLTSNGIGTGVRLTKNDVNSFYSFFWTQASTTLVAYFGFEDYIPQFDYSFGIFCWQGQWNIDNVTDSMKYQIGYAQGSLDTYHTAFNEGYSKGQLNYASSYYVKQSQAFQKAMCELYVAKQNTQSYPFLLTESGFTSFNVGGGVAYFSILDELERDFSSQGYFPQYIDITFDDDYPLVITSNSDLNLFNVANDLPVVFVTDYLDTGIYGFYTYNDKIVAASDNWGYVVGYKISHIYIYYNYSYTNFTVVPTESTSFNINNDSYFLFDLYSATTNNLYGQGYDNGYSVGYQSGYNKGYFERGDSNFTFDNLLTAAIDVPVKAFTGLFNFELLGVNLKSFILTIFTLAIVLKITSYIL